MKAQIMDIKRFAVHDGDGIRTTVFFKGCPLRCVWCHNPEGLQHNTQISYAGHKCINCGICGSLCKANQLVNGIHGFNREECTFCGKCESNCPSRCFHIYGKTYSSDELLNIVMEDKEFYENSGGGVTLSGGECLIQADFCREFLMKCKQNGLSTAVDTCGYVPWSAFEKVNEYTDVFLYDVKAYDDNVHIACTGVSNQIILDNLKRLDQVGKKFEIRIPYIPGHNSDQIDKIGMFLSELHNITGVKILPYHNLSESKYAALAMESHMPTCTIPARSEIANAEQTIGEFLEGYTYNT